MNAAAAMAVAVALVLAVVAAKTTVVGVSVAVACEMCFVYFAVSFAAEVEASSPTYGLTHQYRRWTDTELLASHRTEAHGAPLRATST